MVCFGCYNPAGCSVVTRSFLSNVLCPGAYLGAFTKLAESLERETGHRAVVIHDGPTGVLSKPHWQDAIIRQLEIIGEASKQISPSLEGVIINGQNSGRWPGSLERRPR